MSTLTDPSTVIIDLQAGTKDDAIAQLAATLAAAGRVSDVDGFLVDVRDRESQMATGLPGGIGIPHARSAHVTTPSVAVGVAPSGVDFGAPDGPANLIFLIAAPDGADQDHLKILAKLARKLISEEFTGELRAARDGQTVADIIARDVVL
ncbi:PTS sugar transporter subunit IIA [Microbacteriaceae bacterium VKM Ac-2855]|nr:PTS sugar transporter subunit IIA [Microbacteriaceae bacterium VKM Ac-2855]